MMDNDTLNRANALKSEMDYIHKEWKACNDWLAAVDSGDPHSVPTCPLHTLVLSNEELKPLVIQLESMLSDRYNAVFAQFKEL